MRTIYFILLIYLLLPLGVYGQYPGSIEGNITDEKGEPVIGAIIEVFSGGIKQGGTASDYDGFYVINPLQPGKYELVSRYGGYKNRRVMDITVQKNRITVVNIAFEPSKLEEVVIKYEAPRIADGPVTNILSREDIKHMPTISMETVVTSAGPGLRSGGRDRGISAGGSRSAGDVMYIDGASIRGSEPIRDYERVGSRPTEPVPAASPVISAGKLTSGEVNDFGKWDLWKDMSSGELEAYSTNWEIKPKHRYIVVVSNNALKPVHNAKVKLMMKGSGDVLWEAVTDNTGKAELWADMFMERNGIKKLSADIFYNGKRYTLNTLKTFSKGINTIKIAEDCYTPKEVDVAFIVDATGSMGDEIEYLKAELTDIVRRVKDSLPDHDLQIGGVFYRDEGDEYVTKYSQLDGDINKVMEFIRSNGAGGGGDTPEGVDDALDEALNSLKWRDDAIARIAFLVLDAPPHGERRSTVQRVKALTYKYAQQGIRLVPIACSGIDKNTEYLMRSMALATNGTYLFLTNHSGIGGSHIAPSTDKFDVEYMNMLVYRIIYQFSYTQGCESPMVKTTDTSFITKALAPDTLATSDSSLKTDQNNVQTSISWKFFPNPSNGIIHLEYQNVKGQFYVSDVSGNLLLQFDAQESGKSTLDLSDLPSGTYFIKYQYEPDKWLSGKFVLLH
ncbi:MAG TPA: carboxypeptidase regulatory-like domain-containing protein [Flavipsychrobacter sp.]|nr:carboxypeptidase regulatory-like domain-containing protein [Flavipsychrobacter sp.]